MLFCPFLVFGQFTSQYRSPYWDTGRTDTIPCVMLITKDSSSASYSCKGFIVRKIGEYHGDMMCCPSPEKYSYEVSSYLDINKQKFPKETIFWMVIYER